MTNSEAILATTSKEIREHAQAARGQSERDIVLSPVDFAFRNTILRICGPSISSNKWGTYSCLTKP